MSTRIAVVHDDVAEPALLGSWLVGAAAVPEFFELSSGNLPDVTTYDGLVLLGVQSADDVLDSSMMSLAKAAVADNVPTLAVGAAAHVVAYVIGGNVERNIDEPLLGSGLVSKKDAAWTDPLFADLPLLQDVIHWQWNTIEHLPIGATVCASTPDVSIQAFRYGKYMYGLTFHIETTPEVVSAWLAQTISPDLIPELGFDEQSLVLAHRNIGETWRPFVSRFVALVAGEIAPAEGKKRSLPML